MTTLPLSRGQRSSDERSICPLALGAAAPPPRLSQRFRRLPEAGASVQFFRVPDLIEVWPV
jgi:hypothetical protein